jgi:hypothetical protein
MSSFRFAPVGRRDRCATLEVLARAVVVVAIGLLASCAAPAASTPSPVTTGSADFATSTTAAATPTTRPAPTAIDQVSPIAPPSPGVSPGGTALTGTPTTTEGYLEGRASIGPLAPVERVGVPSPTPPPQVCTSRGLAIFRADGRTLVTSFNLQADCTYRVALPPGEYVVRLKPGVFGFSKDLPKTVQIESGRTTRLDLHIDTGIR